MKEKAVRTEVGVDARRRGGGGGREVLNAGRVDREGEELLLLLLFEDTHLLLEDLALDEALALVLHALEGALMIAGGPDVSSRAGKDESRRGWEETRTADTSETLPPSLAA